MSLPPRIDRLIEAEIRTQRPRLVAAAAAGAVLAVAAVGLLGLSGAFITGAALAGAAGAAAVQAFNYLTPGAVIRFLAILRTGARYVERVAGHEAALGALARLRPALFRAVADGPPEVALRLSSGEASARLVQDVDALQTLFVRRSAPWSLGAGAAAAVLMAGVAAPLAGLALALAMALAAGGCLVIARRIADPAGLAVQAAVGALKDRLSALEAVAPELKAYGLDRWAVEEVERAAGRLDAAWVDQVRAGAGMLAWQAAATALAVAGVASAAAGADLPLVALAVLAAVTGVEAASGLAGALQQQGGAAEAVRRLEQLPAGQRRDGSPARPGASLELAAARLRLDPPARLGVVGASGSGKTTLIERLAGLRQALAGEARLGGCDSADMPPSARRALFAYASQDVRLLDGTVRENLRLAGPADDAALWRALDDAALGARFRDSRDGLDTPIGPNGERLSGGERRRLGLARAYLRSAPWLLLDEPTEGLDAATEARVLDGLRRRLDAAGQGLILVSHRTPPVQVCETVIRVEGLEPDGRVRLAPQRRKAVV